MDYLYNCSYIKYKGVTIVTPFVINKINNYSTLKSASAKM